MLVIVLLAILPFSLGDRCQHPPPAANYQNSLYQGRWYEIGKVINQTNFFSTQFQNHFGESNFSFYCQVFHIVILNDEWSLKKYGKSGYVILFDNLPQCSAILCQFFHGKLHDYYQRLFCLPENEIRYLPVFFISSPSFLSVREN